MAKNNYEEMSKVELLALCEKAGIETRSRDTKADLVTLLKEADKAKEKAKKKAEKPAKKAAKEKAPKEESKKEPKVSTSKSKKKSKKQEKVEKLRARERQTKEATQRATAEAEATAAAEAAYRPRVYSQAPVVHMIDEDDAGADLNPQYTKDDIELMASKQDPLHYLTGRISGSGQTSYQRVGERNVAYVNALVQFGARTVQIPSFQFFEDWMNEDRYDPTGWYKYMQERVGSEIDFNVILRDDDGPVPDYYGTRFHAMKKKRCDRWYSKIKDGSWYFRENQLVQARVVAARESGLIIEIEGAETFIPKTEVAHEFVNSARDYAKPGDRVVVAIYNIERKPIPNNISTFNFPVTYKASIKKATLDPRQIYFQDFQRGSTHLATVTNIIIEKDKPVFYCNVEGKADIYCWMREGVRRLPEKGEQVMVKISGSDPDSKRIWGAIIHVVSDVKNQQEFTVLNI